MGRSPVAKLVAPRTDQLVHRRRILTAIDRLHRLRKLLGHGDLIVQREGKLRLATERVWVDLEDWEARLGRALKHEIAAEAEAVFRAFPGPLLQDEAATAWALPVVERVRSKFVDLALRLGRRMEAGANRDAAVSVYLRALDLYPTSERCYEAFTRAARARRHGGSPRGLSSLRAYPQIIAAEPAVSGDPCLAQAPHRLTTHAHHADCS